MDIQKLIACVKKYPVLYDMDHCEYRSLKKKDQIWDEIGEELQENGEELKKKWKNLRDCYARYIRSWDMKTIHTAPYTTRYYKFWPWAKQMEIFRPYLKFAQVQTETELNGGGGDTSDPISNLHLPSYASESFEHKKRDDEDDDDDIPRKTAPTKKRKQHETESSVDKVIKYLKEKRKKSAVVNSNELNATEHMFLSFAKTIATFSVRRQASVKMRIANMVLEEELFEKEENEENALKSELMTEDADEDQKFEIGNSTIGS